LEGGCKRANSWGVRKVGKEGRDNALTARSDIPEKKGKGKYSFAHKGKGQWQKGEIWGKRKGAEYDYNTGGEKELYFKTRRQTHRGKQGETMDSNGLRMLAGEGVPTKRQKGGAWGIPRREGGHIWREKALFDSKSNGFQGTFHRRKRLRRRERKGGESMGIS